MPKVRLTKAQMAMLDECFAGNIEGHAEVVGKTFVEASKEQLAHMEQVVCEFATDEEWLLHECLFDPASTQADFFLRQKEKCADNLVEKLSAVAYSDE